MTDPATGQLVVVSGPSGVGKSTVLRGLVNRFGDRLKLSVSATTRPPRPGERDGHDYHFLTAEEFEGRRRAGEFLECFEVFGRGFWYGTLFDEVMPSLNEGKWVILEIDVDGARAVLEQFPDALTIFLHAGSLEELERRLRARGTDTQEAIERRLQVARRELSAASIYKHQIVNDRDAVGRAIDQISEILVQHGFVQDEESCA